MESKSSCHGASAVIEYSKAKYQEVYKEEFVVDFDHGPLTKGDIDSAEAHRVISVLNACTHLVAPCISFDPMRLEKQLEGGSCSAIALRVGKRAVTLLEEFDRHLISLHALVESVQRCVEEIHIESVKKNKTCQALRKNTRSIQAAFNTIAIQAVEYAGDVAQAKIKALAAYHQLAVAQSTPEIKVADNPHFEDELSKQLYSLSDGTYLLRIIQYENNHKQEKHGHSVIYMKHHRGVELYFDTQLGLYDLANMMQNRFDKKHLVYNSLQSANIRFQVDYCKFHRLVSLLNAQGE